MNIFERLESEVRGYCRTWPTVFDTASNARQWDVDGNEYIDFFSGAGVLNFGHNPPRIRDAILDYLQRGGVTHSLDMSSLAKQQFMERFEEVILKPRSLSYRMQFTSPTGSNVVEAALKLARKVTGRRQVVAFSNGFHGMTLGSLACTSNAKFRDASGVDLPNVYRMPYDGYFGEGIDTLEIIRRQFDDPSSGLSRPAAFIVEVIQAEGGINLARPEWLQGLEKLAHELGALLIVDDIQVSNGRTGRYFSFEDMGISPDMVCLAKGLGGYGLPIGMLLIKPEHDQWQPGEHTGTFRGQNLSFVAGAEALSFFTEEGFLPAVIDKGEYTAGRIAAMIKGRHAELRGRGMIHGIDTGSGEVAAAVVQRAFEAGLLVPTCGPNGRVVKIIAPLTIEQEVLERGLDILERAIDREV